jgi:hypothetical protein
MHLTVYAILRVLHFLLLCGFQIIDHGKIAQLRNVVSELLVALLVHVTLLDMVVQQCGFQIITPGVIAIPLLVVLVPLVHLLALVLHKDILAQLPFSQIIVHGLTAVLLIVHLEQLIIQTVDVPEQDI